MNEDVLFNAFLKEKLEEGLVVPAVAEPKTRAGAVFSSRALRVAASLAVICGIGLGLFRHASDQSQERAASQTIAFLAACQGAPIETERAVTFAERLLAWQDAPYAEIMN